eukprot:s2733_g4.t1
MQMRACPICSLQPPLCRHGRKLKTGYVTNNINDCSLFTTSLYLVQQLMKVQQSPKKRARVVEPQQVLQHSFLETGGGSAPRG